MSASAPIAVAWCDFQPRTEALAAALGGQARFIRAGWLRRYKVLLPLRYVRDALETWKQLNRADPSMVLVITPPVFAPLLVWLWCATRRRMFLVDCHTGAFDSPRWRWARPLHRWVLRRARAVAVHTEQAETLLKSWGANALMLPDDVPDVSQAALQPVPTEPRVVVAGSLDPQEPVAAAIEAARLMPDVEVRFTGDASRIPAALRSRAPANATFTGYLAYPTFLGELQAAHAVAAFSTDPQIMNRAAFEAVGLGRPLVLSDLPGLRARFGGAALFCRNEPVAMADALRQALRDRDRLSRQSERLEVQLRAQREAAVARFKFMLQAPPKATEESGRVLIVSQHPYPSHYILRRNVDHLLAQGLQVDLVCTGRDGAASPPQPRLRCYSIRVAHRRLRFWYPFEYLLFFVLALPLVCVLAIGRRYQAVQVDTLPDFLVFIAFLPRWRGARVVLYMQELMPEMATARLRVGTDHLLIRLLSGIERAATAWADQVVTVSDRCSRILAARGVPPTKIAVVPNSLPISHQVPNRVMSSSPASDATTILMTHATLVERYGVQVAIRALAQLHEDWPNLSLQILGAGEYQPNLVRLAADLGVARHLIFRGFLPWPEAMEAVRQATLGIVSIIDDGYGHLLLPGKLFDYVLQRVPVVCSRLLTIQEYFPPDSVAYFPPGDAAGLAAQIDRLLRDPEEARQQASRAIVAVGSLQWERVSPRYVAALGTSS